MDRLLVRSRSGRVFLPVADDFLRQAAEREGTRERREAEERWQEKPFGNRI